jgi:S1-C subfamily serine protease
VKPATVLRIALLSMLAGIGVGCCAATLPPLDVANNPDSPIPEGVVLPYVASDLTVGCSAVAIEPDVLVTARHCILAILEESHGSDQGVIVAPDGRVLSVTEDWASPEADVALLHVDGKLAAFALVAPRVPEVGEDTWVAGYGCDTHDFHFALSARASSMLGRNSHGQYAIRGLVCHGDSGGGLFDDEGHLLGVNSSVLEDPTVSEFFVTPVAYALDGLTGVSPVPVAP